MNYKKKYFKYKLKYLNLKNNLISGGVRGRNKEKKSSKIKGIDIRTKGPKEISSKPLPPIYISDLINQNNQDNLETNMVAPIPQRPMGEFRPLSHMEEIRPSHSRPPPPINTRTLSPVVSTFVQHPILNAIFPPAVDVLESSMRNLSPPVDVLESSMRYLSPPVDVLESSMRNLSFSESNSQPQPEQSSQPQPEQSSQPQL